MSAPAPTTTPATTPAIRNLKDWRRLRSRTYTTTDGLTLTLRHCSVLDLAEEGAIPQVLLARLQQYNSLSEDKLQSAAMSDMDSFATMVNAVVCSLVKAPRILSRKAATDLIDAVHATYDGQADREAVAAWLDQAMVEDEPPVELAGPRRAELVARYTNAILVEELDWNDRQEIFTLAMGGMAPLAAFPEPAS